MQEERSDGAGGALPPTCCARCVERLMLRLGRLHCEGIGNHCAAGKDDFVAIVATARCRMIMKQRALRAARNAANFGKTAVRSDCLQQASLQYKVPPSARLRSLFESLRLARRASSYRKVSNLRNWHGSWRRSVGNVPRHQGQDGGILRVLEVLRMPDHPCAK
jgi:hypothetical protein